MQHCSPPITNTPFKYNMYFMMTYQHAKGFVGIRVGGGGQCSKNSFRIEAFYQFLFFSNTGQLYIVTPITTVKDPFNDELRILCLNYCFTSP